MKAKAGRRPIIAVTMGDAAGVGPELCLRILSEPFSGGAVPLVIGCAGVLERVASELKRPYSAPVLTQLPDALTQPSVFEPPGVLDARAVQPGRNQACCGRAAARFIEEAVKGCLEKRCAAMVTAPISKKALHMAGINYPGHTEMLADLTHAARSAMLFSSTELCCAFVTCHQSLRSVAESLTIERVVEVAELAWEHVSALRGDALPLCLLGLNPHAGEEGLFGDEENGVLIPARMVLEKRGIPVEGPVPPDVAFVPEMRRRFSCHIAMYHDQASIPFKMLAFDSGVNVTMGLPIIRTSPDHGTAFDIAWRGTVRPGSFLAACELAARLASPQRSVARGRP